MSKFFGRSILLKAENKALRQGMPLNPEGWRRSGVGDSRDFQPFKDVGDLLAYAAWTADFLSITGKP